MANFKNFWTDITFNPKQDFKWQVKVDLQEPIVQGGNSYLPPFYAKSVTKPSFSVNVKTYKLVNRQIKQPSNLTWEPINIVFIDTERSLIASFISKYLEKTEYDNINKKTLTNTTTSKVGSNNYITGLTIDHLDSEGNPRERWTLRNPQISKFQASELSYESDNLSTYTITVDYDWAELDPNPDQPLGSNINQSPTQGLFGGRGSDTELA